MKLNSFGLKNKETPFHAVEIEISKTGKVGLKKLPSVARTHEGKD